MNNSLLSSIFVAHELYWIPQSSAHRSFLQRIPPSTTFPATPTLCNIPNPAPSPFLHPHPFQYQAVPSPSYPLIHSSFSREFPSTHIPYPPTLCNISNHPLLFFTPTPPQPSCPPSHSNAQITLKSNQLKFKLKKPYRASWIQDHYRYPQYFPLLVICNAVKMPKRDLTFVTEFGHDQLVPSVLQHNTMTLPTMCFIQVFA